MTIDVLYFASLRDAAGREREAVPLPAGGLAALYEDLRARYRFALGREQVRVALNGEFVTWQAAVRDGDEERTRNGDPRSRGRIGDVVRGERDKRADGQQRWQTHHRDDVR